MNKFKKLASLVLALVMALALAAPAFAAETDAPETTTPAGDQKLTMPEGERTYNIYQIFTGDLEEKDTLSSVKWGQNGTGELGKVVPGDKLNELEAIKDSTDNQGKWAVIEGFVDLKGDPYQAGVKGGTTVTVPAGYYLIRDMGEVGEGEAYSFYLVEVVGPTTLKAKTGETTVDKVIVEDDEEKKTNNAAVGDSVNYKITGTLPENYEDYITYYYCFTDTLSAGLTYNADLKIMADGQDVTELFGVIISPENYDEEDHAETTIEISCSNLKEAIPTLTKDSKIVLTYSATLNENAKIGIVEGNPNKVDLKYSNDPNNSKGGTDEDGNPTDPTGKTPESEVITYTTELEITKVDQDGNKLQGAEFTLTGEGLNTVLVSGVRYVEAENGGYWELKDGTYTQTSPATEGISTDNYVDVAVQYKQETYFEQKKEGTEQVSVSAWVDENGVVKFTGLKAGEYTLTETKTPAGFNTINPIKFTITFTTNELDQPVYNVENVTEGYEISVGETAGTLATSVVNVNGATLPSTGGIGTTIFYVVGGVLAAGAVILLITKRRMNIEK